MRRLWNHPRNFVWFLVRNGRNTYLKIDLHLFLLYFQTKLNFKEFFSGFFYEGKSFFFLSIHYSLVFQFRWKKKRTKNKTKDIRKILKNGKGFETVG